VPGKYFKTKETNMNRPLSTCKAAASATLLLVILVATSAFAAGKAQTYTGKVSDAMCGAEHMEPGVTAGECTRACVAKGSKYALVVGDKVYTLDGEDKGALQQLDKLAGEKAKVIGVADADTIHVTSVAAAK
jgi:hypothetical protein